MTGRGRELYSIIPTCAASVTSTHWNSSGPARIMPETFQEIPIDANRAPRHEPPGEASDAALWTALRTGDEAAFEQLFRRYATTLCDFAYSYVDDVDVAEDVVHSLFVS